MSDKQFLDHAYGLEGVDETRAFYDDWAGTYDAEVTENGYATPGRSAAALKKFVEVHQPVLDFGCGTGLSGAAFHAAGFTAIDGCDLTPGMLEQAAARDVYRNTWQADVGTVDTSRGPYAAIAAIGVIGSGAAPVEVFYDLTSAMDAGSYFVFSFNDHTVEDPSFEGAVMNCCDSGAFELVFKDYGPHLPKRGIKSWVYVMRKR